MKRTIFALFTLVLAGCSYPNSSVRTVDSRPAIAIANASPTAVLLVNGVQIGPAAAYDGIKAKLQLDRGTHKVTIQDMGRVVYETTVYLGDEVTKTITVP